MLMGYLKWNSKHLFFNTLLKIGAGYLNSGAEFNCELENGWWYVICQGSY